jgi:membrane fusion protein (multidrug efflux system)
LFVNSRRVRWFAGIAAVIAVLALIKVGLDRGHPTAGGAGARPGGASGSGPTGVRVEVVQAERMADRITAVGTIRPNEMVDVRSEIAGRVREIRFREGVRVAAGDLLVKIDDSELRAQLARAESRVTVAEKEAQRQQPLHEQRVTSAREFDNVTNNLAVAKAEADLIRAQLAKTDIRAPFAGLVGLRNVSNGSYVSAATLITTLVDDQPVKVDFAVPERYAGHIAKGHAIHFTVEGTARAFEGTVYALESAIDPATRTLGVRATSPNPDGAIVPGAFAEVEVVFPERDAVLVPSYALIPEIRGHRVVLYRGGRAEARPVRIGTRTEDRVEIVEGLAAGDTLITSGLLQLKSGAPVSVLPEE